MALYSNLPSGGSSARSRSTKLHKGSARCVNNEETTIFEFSGGGKINKMLLTSDLNSGADSYLVIVVDGYELYKHNGSLSANGNYYLFRITNGNLTVITSYSSEVLPLDIEFKSSFKILMYATNGTPLINYTAEISED